MMIGDAFDVQTKKLLGDAFIYAEAMPRFAGLSFASVCASRVAGYYTCARWDNYGRHYQTDISTGLALALEYLGDFERADKRKLEECLENTNKAVELSGANLAREPERLLSWRSASAAALLFRSLLHDEDPIWSTRHSLIVLADVIADKKLLLRTFLEDFRTLRLARQPIRLPLWPVGAPHDWLREPPIYGNTSTSGI